MRGKFIAIAFVLTTTCAIAQRSIIESKNGTHDFNFRAVASPGGLKIDGKLSDPKALVWALLFNGKSVSGVSKLRMDALDTGIELRNQHLREKYLDVKKFKTSTFSLNKMTLPNDPLGADFEKDGIPFEGTLRIKNSVQPVKGTAWAKKSGENLEMKFDFSLKLSQYGIAAPSFMGVTVGETTEVTVKLAAPVKKRK